MTGKVRGIGMDYDALHSPMPVRSYPSCKQLRALNSVMNDFSAIDVKYVGWAQGNSHEKYTYWRNTCSSSLPPSTQMGNSLGQGIPTVIFFFHLWSLYRDLMAGWSHSQAAWVMTAHTETRRGAGKRGEQPQERGWCTEQNAEILIAKHEWISTVFFQISSSVLGREQNLFFHNH